MILMRTVWYKRRMLLSYQRYMHSTNYRSWGEGYLSCGVCMRIIFWGVAISLWKKKIIHKHKYVHDTSRNIYGCDYPVKFQHIMLKSEPQWFFTTKPLTVAKITCRFSNTNNRMFCGIVRKLNTVWDRTWTCN